MRILQFLFTMMVLSVSGQETKGSGEEEKIKEVIIGETAAYEEGSIDKWRNVVTQSPKMTYLYGLQDGTTGHVVGFKALEKMILEWIADKEKSDYKTIERTHWNIKITGNTAWATYKEKAMVDGEMLIGEEIRILEKIDGKWKIDLVAFIF